MYRKVCGFTRASSTTQYLAATLILAVRSTSPVGSPACPNPGFSGAALVVRSPARPKLLSSLAGEGTAVASDSRGRPTRDIALSAEAGTRIVMGNHDRSSGIGASGIGSTSPLQGFLETSFASTVGPAAGERAETGGGVRVGKGVVNDRSVIVHAYSGNEACDADSICSAIGMAFLENSLASVVEDRGGDQGAGGFDETRTSVHHVPVMPIPRADLALRREVLVLMSMCGVDPSAVVFIDDVDLPRIQAEGRLRLTLMDHNAASGNLEGLGDAVVEIVDHHMDLGKHAHVQVGARDIAFDVHEGVGRPLVGSCCTLVAERMLERASHLLSPDVARLLLGVMLIDTNDLDVGTRRATPRDVAAAKDLSLRVVRETPNPHPVEELFDTLRNAKFDPEFWGTLSARDCLRYDYKQFSTIPGSRNARDSGGDARRGKFGMSSILCRVKALAAKPRAAAALREFALEHDVDSLAVMTVTLGEEGDMKKELLVFAGNERRSEQIREFLESSQEGAFLRLRRRGSWAEGSTMGSDERGFCDRQGGNGGSNRSPEDGWFLWWELGNAVPSRKQIAPVMMSFYESLEP